MRVYLRPSSTVKNIQTVLQNSNNNKDDGISAQSRDGQFYQNAKRREEKREEVEEKEGVKFYKC